MVPASFKCIAGGRKPGDDSTLFVVDDDAQAAIAGSASSHGLPAASPAISSAPEVYRRRLAELIEHGMGRHFVSLIGRK